MHPHRLALGAVLLSIASATTDACSQSIDYTQLTLLDETPARETAWTRSCSTPAGSSTLLGDDRTGLGPNGRFATNSDGDIAGWRFDRIPGSNPPELDPLRIPMVWIRSDPGANDRRPVRLPVPAAGASAAATGVVRVRTCPDAPPTDLFVCGWREIGSHGAMADFAPMLWHLAWTPTGYADPVIVPVLPRVCDGIPPQLQGILLPTTEGSAWTNGAIDVVYSDQCPDPAWDPVIVLYGTQSYRCACNGVTEAPNTRAPMRLEFRLSEWLAYEPSGGTCDCPDPCPPWLRWQLTDGLPVVAADTMHLAALREPMSVTHQENQVLAVVRDGLLQTRRLECGASGFGANFCVPPTSGAIVGGMFGSLAFDEFETAKGTPKPRYILGRTSEEPVFPAVNATPNIGILSPIGMELVVRDIGSIAMVNNSRQYESAARGTGSTFEQITAGWRLVDDLDPDTTYARFRPMAWAPMSIDTGAPLCPETGAGPDGACDPIILDSPAPTPDPEQVYGVAEELPRAAVGPETEDNAWALGCEFVSRERCTREPQFVGGGDLGARVWHRGGAGWQVQLLDPGTLTEAQSIMPDGTVVVLGRTNCTAASEPPLLHYARLFIPPSPPRPGDANADGSVNAADLSALLAAWGTAAPSADFNCDGDVDAADLSALLANWSAQ